MSVAYPEEIIYYTESKFGYGSSTVSDLNKKAYLGKFKVLPIAGQPKEISTYVAAPKTEWGDKVISDINEALSKLKSNPEYINEDREFNFEVALLLKSGNYLSSR
ncbi:hypothetical protein [Aeromonas caviae]|uniref:hypothetical protein n=1 Tax=Aeromonas caviae TaxID=648 RepID=UPI002B487177|nr:hypothetical protein [Aeromonas caviae]